jgi:hypothetical protein
VIDQVRAVLETYRTRVAIQIYAAALPVILLISFLLFSMPPGHPVTAYLALVAPAVAIFFAVLGEHMKIQFASWRSKLTPDYARTHLIAAFVVTSILLLLQFLLSLAFFPLVPPHVSLATLAALWTLSLFTFSVGYFFVPQVVYLFLMVTMFNGTPVRWVEGMDRSAAVVVLAADLVLTAALLRRMLSATEEKFEYRAKSTPEEAERNMWSRFSKRTWVSRITRGESRILDRPRPLARDAISQIRHFKASMQSSHALLMTTAIFVAMFWAVSLITGSGKFAVDPTMFVALPTIIVFTQMQRPGKNLQSTFLLPLRREQIVFRYGAALLLLLLEEWLAFVLALVIADWMPIPGKIGRFVPITGILISLASQLPMFGIFTLCIGRSMVSIAVLLIIAIVSLSLAGVQWSLIAILVSGPALIWFSYHHWCHAEIGANKWSAG